MRKSRKKLLHLEQQARYNKDLEYYEEERQVRLEAHRKPRYSGHLKRCSSAGTAIDLSARCHAEDIIVTIAHFASILAMSMTVSRETG